MSYTPWKVQKKLSPLQYSCATRCAPDGATGHRTDGATGHRTGCTQPRQTCLHYTVTEFLPSIMHLLSVY